MSVTTAAAGSAKVIMGLFTGGTTVQITSRAAAVAKERGVGQMGYSDIRETAWGEKQFLCLGVLAYGVW